MSLFNHGQLKFAAAVDAFGVLVKRLIDANVLRKSAEGVTVELSPEFDLYYRHPVLVIRLEREDDRPPHQRAVRASGISLEVVARKRYKDFEDVEGTWEFAFENDWRKADDGDAVIRPLDQFAPDLIAEIQKLTQELAVS